MADHRDRRSHPPVHRLHGDVGVLRRPPVVPRGQALGRLLDGAAHQGDARCDLRVVVLRAHLREPADRPLAHADDQDPHPRTGGRRPGPSGPGALPAVADPARLRRSRPHRGARRLSRVADVPPVAERLRAFVRHHRAALPSRPGVLRVLVAVAPLRAGVALLLARRRDADRGDRAFRMGWDPAAGTRVRRQGGSRRARPPVGPARPDHADEGMGLLPGQVRPADVAARCRRGGVVHRRACAAAGAELPGDRRCDLRGAVPGEHPRAVVEPAGDRGRPARAGLGPARHGVPGFRAAVQRQAAGAAARDALHRGQHHRDTQGLRLGQDRHLSTSRGPERVEPSARRERAHGVQHPPVAPVGALGELPVAAADPAVLRVQGRGRGSLRRVGFAARADGLGSRDQSERHPGWGPNVAEHTPGLHARIRRGRRTGEHGDDRGRAAPHPPRHPSRGNADDRRSPRSTSAS